MHYSFINLHCLSKLSQIPGNCLIVYAQFARSFSYKFTRIKFYHQAKFIVVDQTIDLVIHFQVSFRSFTESVLNALQILLVAFASARIYDGNDILTIYILLSRTANVVRLRHQNRTYFVAKSNIHLQQLNTRNFDQNFCVSLGGVCARICPFLLGIVIEITISLSQGIISIQLLLPLLQSWARWDPVYLLVSRWIFVRIFI